MTNFGWQYDEEKILAASDRLAQAGHTFSFAADRPALKGWWKAQQAKGVAYVSAQVAEKELTGKWRDPNHQQRGTCVGQGSSRAIEDVHNARIVANAIIGKPTQIVYETMYGYERNKRWGRTHDWGCGCGRCPDGLMGADAAAYYTTEGAIARANYKAANVDLSSPREELAIGWNNTGVPPVLVAAGHFHRILCHSSDSWEDYADAIAAEHYGHVCLPKLFGYSRVSVGPYGTVEPDSDGGHDTECIGTFTLPNGETGFQMQQSWGKGIKYPPRVQTINGWVDLRPGSYVVRISVLQGIRGGVERISSDISSGSSFREI